MWEWNFEGTRELSMMRRVILEGAGEALTGLG